MGRKHAWAESMHAQAHACTTHTRMHTIHTHAHTQPTFRRLGIAYDARTAQALLRRERGLAAQLLYAVRAAVAGMDCQAKVMHGGRTVMMRAQ
jgi:hypothetical protein